MAKTTVKAIVKEVLPVETYGDQNQGKRQSIILFIPGYVNEFGDKVTQDEEWKVEAFNDQITKLKLGDLTVKTRIEAELNIRSRSFEKKDNTGTAHIISATFRSITVIPRNTSAPTATESTPEDDDLPF